MKVVQFNHTITPDGKHCLIVLTDDGSLWEFHNGSWIKFKPVGE